MSELRSTELGEARPGAWERAGRIQLVIFDVDGVLTDGTIWFAPLPVAATGDAAAPAFSLLEIKGFSAHDGVGISLARMAGLRTGVITKRHTEAVAARARDLKMDFVRQGIEHKQRELEAVAREAALPLEQICCVGDDLIDLPMMRLCGLAAAPANARPEVQRFAHFVTRSTGGAGAARDVIEFVLQARGIQQEILERFLQARS